MTVGRIQRGIPRSISLDGHCSQSQTTNLLKDFSSNGDFVEKTTRYWPCRPTLNSLQFIWSNDTCELQNSSTNFPNFTECPTIANRPDEIQFGVSATTHCRPICLIIAYRSVQFVDSRAASRKWTWVIQSFIQELCGQGSAFLKMIRVFILGERDSSGCSCIPGGSIHIRESD
jgi:hypothetical protein